MRLEEAVSEVKQDKNADMAINVLVDFCELMLSVRTDKYVVAKVARRLGLVRTTNEEPECSWQTPGGPDIGVHEWELIAYYKLNKMDKFASHNFDSYECPDCGGAVSFAYPEDHAEICCGQN